MLDESKITIKLAEIQRFLFKELKEEKKGKIIIFYDGRDLKCEIRTEIVIGLEDRF